ncbi:unnamed protein product [Phytophthora lilii]|uniref:Unnamed protein product n=1 Tax=Phytophthora lilii TaxID=2077276 RepID=A0A9W7CIZ9_9STRA|nr:unnamed protein product [Phytophthora lilii]
MYYIGYSRSLVPCCTFTSQLILGHKEFYYWSSLGPTSVTEHDLVDANTTAVAARLFTYTIKATISVLIAVFYCVVLLHILSDLLTPLHSSQLVQCSTKLKCVIPVSTFHSVGLAVAMADDASPPPPPPLSPPPAPQPTTIGRYIARFRYEQPRPREQREAPTRADFWWTRSPRYSRSPSPPSTWASGGVFFADEGDEDGDEEAGVPSVEGTQKALERSVDSVESDLRRRLGVWSGDFSAADDAAPSTASQSLRRSWGSEDSALAELEEDPEEVIERVRRRLGWASTSTASASRLRPINLRLSVSGDTPPQLRLTPPLSPASRSREALDTFGYSSWDSVEREREYGKHDEEIASVSSSAEVKDGFEVMIVEAKDEGHRSPVTGSEMKTNTREDEGVLTSFADSPLGSSASLAEPLGLGELVAGLDDGEHEHINGKCDAPPDVDKYYARSSSSSSSATCEPNGEVLRQEESRPEDQVQKCSAVHQVPELPLLPTRSPARPDTGTNGVSPSANASTAAEDTHALVSTQDNTVPSETAKTLDSLVSLVVHSWENDFFSDPASEQNGPALHDDIRDYETAKTEDSSGAADNIPAELDQVTNREIFQVKFDGKNVMVATDTAQDRTNAVLSAGEIVTKTEAADTIADAEDKAEELEEDEDDEDSEVPGEEEDQIIKLLLSRISLLEETLRQIDR